jgi:protein TonB
LVAFAILVAFHAVLLWGLATGLARKAIEMIAPPIEVENIEDQKKEEKEPPPPPPKMDIPPPFVPAPDIAIEAPIETPAITVTRQEAPPPPPPPPVRTAPKSDPRRPFSKPEYPAQSKRMGEEGTVVLLLLVAEDGHVADSKIDKSSGFPRLDEAALRESRRWRLIPGKEGDKPIMAWGRFAMVFRLTDAE